MQTNDFCRFYLTVKEITPIIQAFFGGYQWVNEPAYQFEGKQTFLRDNDEYNPTWLDIRNQLQGVGIEYYGMSFTQPTEIKEALIKLSEVFAQKHSNAAERRAYFAHLMEHFDFKQKPSLDAVFLFAQYFDDGHGLEKLENEEVIHNPLPSLKTLTYKERFISSEIAWGQKCEGIELGQVLHDMLITDEYPMASHILLIQIEAVLCSIIDDSKRSAIRKKLIALLTLSDSTE